MIMEQNRQGEGGSGSAENQGKSRQAQQPPQAGNVPNKEDAANVLGTDAGRSGRLQDTGAFSGRDDLAGGDNDGMTTQNSGQDTDR